MPPTGLVRAPVFLQYDTPPGHPERPERLRAIHQRVEESGLADELIEVEASPAELEWIERVHDPRHVGVVRSAFEKGVASLAEDTPVTEHAFDAALHACGGALAAIDTIVEGRWHNAFLAARPPGHHAEFAESMGFCFFNTVVVCARYLRERHGLERVAILDWDVHHGNGTQHLTERDPSIFFASLHQYPHYPGTGAEGERGVGDGEGSVLNCPMPAGSGDAEYLEAFEGTVLPALERFHPDFVVVSAGSDPHHRDPLSDTRVTKDGFRRMSEGVLAVAEGCCAGRLLSCLEGGYDLTGLAESVEVHLSCLLEKA